MNRDALAEELLAYCRANLSAFKCPRSVDFVDDLPRLPTLSRWTHDSPIDVVHARALGLPVDTELRDEVRRLIALYPQPRAHRPTVEFILAPYDGSAPSHRPAARGRHGPREAPAMKLNRAVFGRVYALAGCPARCPRPS